MYRLKPQFQKLLRPLVRRLAGAQIRANHVTVLACALSVGLGVFLTDRAPVRRWFLLLPAWLPIRMALNAVDGMLASEFRQQSSLGAYLNELADVVSDAFLYLPFAYLPGFSALWMGVVIVLAAISEMAGTVAVMTGASRRYDGPMGKSDRALVFGAIGLWVGLAGSLPLPAAYLVPRVVAVLLALTVANRVHHGLQEIRSDAGGKRAAI